MLGHFLPPTLRTQPPHRVAFLKVKGWIYLLLFLLSPCQHMLYLLVVAIGCTLQINDTSTPTSFVKADVHDIVLYPLNCVINLDMTFHCAMLQDSIVCPSLSNLIHYLLLVSSIFFPNYSLQRCNIRVLQEQTL